MKMSTAFRRGRAEHRREAENMPGIYDRCPVCEECRKRCNYNGRCEACPAQKPVVQSMGWNKVDSSHGADCAHCYALFEAEAAGDLLASNILNEIILNLVEQED